MKEFKDKIIKIVEGELPDLTKNAYKVAVDSTNSQAAISCALTVCAIYC